MARKTARWRHPLWNRYRLIHYHTTQPSSPRWQHYGGRGIYLKPQWERDFWAFAQWIEQNLGLPTGQFDYLERIDNNQGYRPGNLRWATPQENSRNTEHCSVIKIGNRRQCLASWLEELGVAQSTYHQRRRRGLTEREALGL